MNKLQRGRPGRWSYEIPRQIAVLTQGGKLIQSTAPLG